MKYLVLALAVSALLATAFAQADSKCDAVLAPSIERSVSDYALAQAYMKINAGYEYEKKKKGETSAIGAGGGYGGFEAEYNSSTSKEDFQEKINQRLSKEGFSMSEFDSRSYYRMGVSDKQVDNWLSCVSGGGLLLTARFPEKDGFVLKVAWRGPRGGERIKLDIKVINGTIDNKKTISTSLTNYDSTNYFVIPAKNAQRIVILAKTKGFSDEISIPRVKPKPTFIIDINRNNDKVGVLGNVFDGYKTSNMERKPPHGMWEATIPAARCLVGPADECKVGWNPSVPEAGKYDLYVQHATTQHRLVEVHVDQAGNNAAPTIFIGLSHVTASPTQPEWHFEGQVPLQKGKNHLWFRSLPGYLPPLINAVRLIKRP